MLECRRLTDFPSPMRRFLLLFAALLTCLSLRANAAEAPATGLGGEIGSHPRLPPTAVSNAPVTPRAPSRDATLQEQLGPLSGLNGTLGAVLTSFLAGAGLALLWSRWRKRPHAAPPAAKPEATPPPADAWQPPVSQGAPVIALALASGHTPADFPLQNFLRSGKATFIRLQEASDRLDLDEIREYTTPEMFAELSMQMHERGDLPQRTDILSLHAELLEVLTEGEYSLASVRFTGKLRTNKGAPEALDEVWHVQKDLRDRHSPWRVAGIQPVTLH